MKHAWMSAVLAGALALGAAWPAGAADHWDMAYIGRMTLPEHVTFEEGEQKSLDFLQTGGIRWTFIRSGMMNGVFYTMTYADGTDFSYGWAASAAVGVPYLVRQGETAYRNKTPSEQMDVIAEHMNEEIRRSGAEFAGSEPLVRISDREHPRWEGAFTITRKENGVTYREAYQMVLQVSGFRVVLGLINSDADRKELTSDLAEMMKERRFYKEKDLLAAFLRNGLGTGRR